MSPFYRFGIAKYARFVEWGVQILRGHYFLNEFGDTQFFCRFDILIWSATLCENFIKSVSFLQNLQMTSERP